MADANDVIPEPIAPTPDDLIPRAEARKAFEARDKAKKEADTYRQQLEARDQADREREAKAKEDELKAAGKWDALSDQLAKKHAAERDGLMQKLTVAEQRWRARELSNAFANASDLFGKDAFTIYNAKAAERIFGSHVKVDDDGHLTIHDEHGEVILDATTGKPASFPVAMRELINGLPDKNDHIRGSGKTGSGSSGGSLAANGPADIADLTARAQRGDKDAIDKLKQRRAAAGGLQMGSAFTR